MLTLQPSQLSQIRAFMTTSIILWYLLFTVMTCLDISFLLDLLPSWLKHFVAIPSNSDRPYTSSSPSTSVLEERSGSPASHKCPVDSLTGYMPGIIVLPSPPPAYPPPASKLAVPAYREHGPPFYRTPPLGPPIIFPKHAADRPMNGSSQCPTALWSIILIKQFKISVVKSNIS